MLCSVIIPLYNKAHFIADAIQSVLNQTYPHFEILVINDGSTDQSAHIAAGISDERIRLINQKNSGVSRARNRGIDEAKGDLIFFLDADDWYEKSYLKTVVFMAKKNPSGTFFATAFQAVNVNASCDVNSLHVSESDQPEFERITDFYHRRLTSGTFFCTNTVAAWRRDLLRLQPCFPVDESLGEDQYLWFRLAEQLDLLYCEKKLAAYRIDVAESLCATQERSGLPAVFERLEKRAKAGLVKPEAQHHALVLVAYERVNVARYLLSNGKRMQAVRELMKNWRSILLKRGWMTFAMCFLCSPVMMKKWESWRK